MAHKQATVDRQRLPRNVQTPQGKSLPSGSRNLIIVIAEFDPESLIYIQRSKRTNEASGKTRFVLQGIEEFGVPVAHKTVLLVRCDGHEHRVYIYCTDTTSQRRLLDHLRSHASMAYDVTRGRMPALLSCETCGTDIEIPCARTVMTESGQTVVARAGEKICPSCVRRALRAAQAEENDARAQLAASSTWNKADDADDEPSLPSHGAPNTLTVGVIAAASPQTAVTSSSRKKRWYHFTRSR